MPKDYFQWLAVLFIHGKQKERQHDENHHKGCECRANRSLRQEKHRQTASSTDAETNDLTLGQAEKKLGFDFCQILGDRHICHGLFPPFISVSEH